MTHLFLLAGDPSQGGGFESLFFLVALFLVFYLFIIRPQSKRQKETQKKVNEIKKGDKVITSGGVIATVNTIDESSVLCEVDKDVKIRFLKTAIVDVNPEKAQ
jgi:preprotein translocase subunit YajC